MSERDITIAIGGCRTGVFGDAVDCADIRDFALPPIAGKRRVVVFTSSVTDLRGVTSALDAARLAHRIVVMRMGEARTRGRFELLREATGWPYLPQIFLDGSFLGGEKELYGHPLILETLPAELRQGINSQLVDSRRARAGPAKERQ